MSRILDETEEYDSWLEAYLDWTVPRSEAPKSFILWAGFYTLASAIRRNVKFPASLLGSYEIYPNLYVIFVGPPGGPRKSTTARYAKTLLREIEHIDIASTASSASKLINIMENTVDGSVSIVSSEFGSFVNVSQEDMYDLLTDIFDCPPEYKYSTRRHGTEVVKNPTINLLAATTPQWVNEQMPAYVIGGGFASRTIFIYEQTPRRRKMYYEDIDAHKLEVLRNALVQDLAHIAHNVTGTFRHANEDVRDAMEGWYKKVSEQVSQDERIEGYLSRKHIHVHKIAMLLSVAESDRLVIEMDHFQRARDILAGIEDRMPRVFSSVGKNPYSSAIEKVRDFVLQQGEVSHSQLLSRFYADIDKNELNQIIESLLLMEDIEKRKNPEPTKKGTYYYPEGEAPSVED